MIASQKIIVLVEDSQNDEILTIRALRKAGVVNEIVVARDGQDAIDIICGDKLQAGQTIQLVILDLKLPKVSGLEVLKTIRSTDKVKNLPVVILSSSRENTDLGSCYEHKANGFVVKPVVSDEFNEAVRRLGLFWILTNEFY